MVICLYFPHFSFHIVLHEDHDHLCSFSMFEPKAHPKYQAILQLANVTNIYADNHNIFLLLCLSWIPKMVITHYTR